MHMVTKISNKKQLILGLKKQLTTRPERALLALQRLYEFQLEDDRDEARGKHRNGRGFDRLDREILTFFAEQLLKNKSLSEKHMRIIFRRIPKYAGQLIENSISSGLIRKEGKFYTW